MGNKNRPESFATVIDTGFDGWGLRSHAWLRKFLEYLKSFYTNAPLVKRNQIVEICVRESRMARFSYVYIDTYMEEWGVQTGACYVNQR